MLIDQLQDILAHVEDEPDADLQALFKRLHGVACAQAVQAEIDRMRSGMAAMFGDLGVHVTFPSCGPA